MLARREPLFLVGRKGGDSFPALLCLPFGNSLTAPAHGREESMGAVAKPQDGALAELNVDNEMSVTIIDDGRRFTKASAVHLSPHWSRSPYSLPEQLGIEAAILNDGNTAAGLSFVKGAPFLSTAFFSRQVEEPIARFVAVTTNRIAV